MSVRRRRPRWTTWRSCRPSPSGSSTRSSGPRHLWYVHQAAQPLAGLDRCLVTSACLVTSVCLAVVVHACRRSTVARRRSRRGCSSSPCRYHHHPRPPPLHACKYCQIAAEAAPAPPQLAFLSLGLPRCCLSIEEQVGQHRPRGSSTDSSSSTPTVMPTSLPTLSPSSSTSSTGQPAPPPPQHRLPPDHSPLLLPAPAPGPVASAVGRLQQLSPCHTPLSRSSSLEEDLQPSTILLPPAPQPAVPQMEVAMPPPTGLLHSAAPSPNMPRYQQQPPSPAAAASYPVTTAPPPPQPLQSPRMVITVHEQQQQPPSPGPGQPGLVAHEAIMISNSSKEEEEASGPVRAPQGAGSSSMTAAAAGPPPASPATQVGSTHSPDSSPPRPMVHLTPSLLAGCAPRAIGPSSSSQPGAGTP